MKGQSNWNYAPYQQALHGDKLPAIVRLAPDAHSLELEWIDPADHNSAHTLYWAVRESDQYNTLTISQRSVVLRGLEDQTEYKLYVERADGTKSPERFFRTGTVPGKLVNYLHPEDKVYAFSGQYLASPSIVRLDNGVLLTSMDVFAGRSPSNLTMIFRSEDGGENWSWVTDLFPCFWGKLFVHRGSLYMLGMSDEYGDLLIGRSEDEGATWTTPTPILRGSADTDEGGPHKAPMPVIRSHGRLWTEIDWGTWNKGGFANSIFSIDENDDFLVAENWSCTGFLEHDRNWPGALDFASCIEGNAVEAPDGSIQAIMRYGENKALAMKIDWRQPEQLPEFLEVLDFPMGHSKFEIQRHPDGTYYAVGNRLPLRNILSVYRSEDLRKWEQIKDIVNLEEMDKQYTGFQYPTFLFEGEDQILVLSRTGYNKPNNFHDSNMQTFYRVQIK